MLANQNSSGETKGVGNGLSVKVMHLITLFTLSLGGCASIIDGQNQVVSVDTGTCREASCELSNDKGKWFISSTPGTVTINRSSDDLLVICKKENKAGKAVVKSSTKGMAFGNIIAGGIIGAAIDCSNGAAYDYPSLIQVMLE